MSHQAFQKHAHKNPFIASYERFLNRALEDRKVNLARESLMRLDFIWAGAPDMEPLYNLYKNPNKPFWWKNFVRADELNFVEIVAISHIINHYKGQSTLSNISYDYLAEHINNISKASISFITERILKNKEEPADIALLNIWTHSRHPAYDNILKWRDMKNQIKNGDCQVIPFPKKRQQLQP